MPLCGSSTVAWAPAFTGEADLVGAILLLPLPEGERVGVRGYCTIRMGRSPLTRILPRLRRAGMSTSPPRGEVKRLASGAEAGAVAWAPAFAGEAKMGGRDAGA